MTRLENMKARYKSEPTIISQLPLKLPNGCEVSEISSSCADCGTEVPHQHLRGHVSRPIPDAVAFNGHGLCSTCITIFPLHGRVRAHGDGMRMEWIKGGRWVSGMLESDTLTGKLRLWLKRQLRTLVR
ncbi:hypothetical protein [Alteromonas gilva]|uniref:Uncharacterized protein n=1 Tax=Alteromonas gilva TaxID=2987522 RepID=A0ABT5L700_9ALTE|nr:hypothetical protein [Alteromonas gilva]MDC8832848.1 hypothetical protein [Alteromonas gilva]